MREWPQKVPHFSSKEIWWELMPEFGDNLSPEGSASLPNGLFLWALLLICFTSLLLPPTRIIFSFFWLNIKLHPRVNFSRQSYSRAYFFEVYCALSLLERRRNPERHRKFRVRNTWVFRYGNVSTRSHLTALHSGTLTHLP